MRIPDDHPLARTYALLDPETAPATAAGMRGTAEPAEIEGLIELVLNPASAATAVTAALRSLEHDSRPVATDAVVRALGSPHPTVRVQAAAEVVRRQLFDSAAGRLRGLLRADPFWQVRRAAVFAIGTDPGDGRWDACTAATDPHWRVRHALVQFLEDWPDRDRIGTELDQLGDGPRVQRLRDYLAYRWAGQLAPARPADDPATWCPFWDWDAAVLARTLDRMGRSGRRAALDVLARLITHPDERVRGWVVQALRDDGQPPHWATALGRLNDPREDTAPPVDQLVRGVELDRLEAVAKFVLRMDAPPPAALAWALGQVGEAFPAEEVSEDLRRLGVTPPLRARPVCVPFPSDHPHARAAALTPGRAHQLIQNPTLETSWFVLARAAQLCRTPLWNLEPATPWKPPALPKLPDTPIALPAVAPVRPRVLGSGGPVVSPLGVSGHYGLPVEGFARAVDQGVNLFFWEPNYATLTRFMTRLTPSDRRQLHLLAGTFEADGAKIRKDAERALRNLKVDQLGVFLIFWVQSWARITDDIRDTLEQLKAAGKVRAFGLSTHNRTLAAEAIRGGWDPVMVRHSAAHRKAEAEVFPIARVQGTSVITFNNTCYGRLLDPGENGEPAFRPADCYRFTLATPGVSACFTAPATPEQLDENLDALRNPELADDVRDQLVRRGEWLYREDTVFRRTIRADV